ncbi:MAG: hypothetical protein HQK53_11620 [Oligoflexia bacterium]|nr:hypothetical protein [Oligoflexia bacterium]
MKNMKNMKNMKHMRNTNNQHDLPNQLDQLDQHSGSFIVLILMTILMYFPADVLAKSDKVPTTTANVITTEEILAKIILMYKKGSYGEAVKSIEKTLAEGLAGEKISKELRATLFYFEGLCYNKLQSFDKSNTAFEQASILGATAPDIYYEQGQALYASQDLNKARQAFAKSAQNQYLVPSSYYYIGYISQVLEQYQLALTNYKKIENASKDIAQAASFQIAEVILAEAEKETSGVSGGRGVSEIEQAVKKYVIPQLEKALAIDSASSLANDIKKRIVELKEKYDLDENKLINGRMISPKSYTISIKEGMAYDTNVISEAEQPTAKAAFKDSLINNAELTAKKRFVFARKYITNPQLRMTKTHHTSNRSSEDIRKNDAYSLIPQLDFQLEHKLFRKMATFLVEGDYNYTGKNVNKDGNLNFYSRATSIGMGEKAQLIGHGGGSGSGGISCGETTVKIKRKFFYSYTPSSDTNTNTLSISQPLTLPAQQLLLVLLTVDLTTAPNDATNTQNVYTTRFDYIKPGIFWGMQFTAALSWIVTDTKLRRDTRGVEQSINPSIGLSRPIGKFLEISAKYDYTKNYSKDKVNYAYNKHLTTLDLQANF